MTWRYGNRKFNREQSVLMRLTTSPVAVDVPKVSDEGLAVNGRQQSRADTHTCAENAVEVDVQSESLCCCSDEHEQSQEVTVLNGLVLGLQVANHTTQELRSNEDEGIVDEFEERSLVERCQDASVVQTKDHDPKIT
eukprot:CAMPEP_0171588674 /NCGR_PEP_ID=MMETSP0961-20121227/14278_1 /TAXON_ID=87120 /ORGANISM="Aurantiochytrium limacinum, Strain ATCCMYA-1381" /LENGTH=136 /DNA_ID=CAMNT_0012147595 /DNA_START=137 /DNA_END=544 /DNA_ORIENTATION=+